MRLWLLAVAVVLVTACGKNSDYGYGGYQAPNPYVSQNPNYPGYNPYQGQNQFRPQNVPAGYPNQYTPWMPLHQYMQQDPYRAQQYQQMLNGWYSHAAYYGYNQYDFSQFWLGYCPQYWNTGYYQYFNTFVYPWVTWNTAFPTQYNPSQYWNSYSGLSFDWMDMHY